MKKRSSNDWVDEKSVRKKSHLLERDKKMSVASTIGLLCLLGKHLTCNLLSERSGKVSGKYSTTNDILNKNNKIILPC